jgi:hypothetical protein
MRFRSPLQAGFLSADPIRIVSRAGLWVATLLVAHSSLQATRLSAQEPRIGTEVDTAVVSVGDRITLTVTVDHPASANVAWPDSLDLAPFEVLGGRATPPVSHNGGSRSSLILTLAAFELGDLEIPSFDVEVISASGESTLLGTSRFGVQVVSVGLDEGGDIRDIKGPLGIPISLLPILLIVLAAGLAGIFARALYKRLRRGDPELRDTAPAAPWRPPHEIALEALDRIQRSPLLENGEIKEYHIQISEVLRRYVEGRFQVPALEMTTLDILPGLEESGLGATTLDGFESFLMQCDMVKFAKHRPEPSAARSLLDLGRHLVEDTVPKHEEVPAGPAQAKGHELQEASP